MASANAAVDTQGWDRRVGRRRRVGVGVGKVFAGGELERYRPEEGGTSVVGPVTEIVPKASRSRKSWRSSRAPGFAQLSLATPPCPLRKAATT